MAYCDSKSAGCRPLEILDLSPEGALGRKPTDRVRRTNAPSHISQPTIQPTNCDVLYDLHVLRLGNLYVTCKSLYNLTGSDSHGGSQGSNPVAPRSMPNRLVELFDLAVIKLPCLGPSRSPSRNLFQPGFGNSPHASESDASRRWDKRLLDRTLAGHPFSMDS